jgi:ribosome-associated protein
VSEQLVITDFFVIASGNSDRQVRTIAEEVERHLKEAHGIQPFRREGEREGHWVLLDYVDFVLHVFQKADRDYYDLERLWSDARRVPFDDGGAVDWRSSRGSNDWEEDEPATAEAT